MKQITYYENINKCLNSSYGFMKYGTWLKHEKKRWECQGYLCVIKKRAKDKGYQAALFGALQISKRFFVN